MERKVYCRTETLIRSSLGTQNMKARQVSRSSLDSGTTVTPTEASYRHVETGQEKIAFLTSNEIWTDERLATEKSRSGDTSSGCPASSRDFASPIASSSFPGSGVHFQSELASMSLAANSRGRVNITSWLPSISTSLNAPRRDDIRVSVVQFVSTGRLVRQTLPRLSRRRRRSRRH